MQITKDIDPGGRVSALKECLQCKGTGIAGFTYYGDAVECIYCEASGLIKPKPAG